MKIDTTDGAASLESAYHRLIPISKHMGLRVVSYEQDRLTLAAPLANNFNHQQSAFGGSLFSVAALAGWGLLQMKFAELDMDCNTVIADGDVAYKRPVFADFECTCELPESYAAFIATLMSSGKSSLVLKPAVTVAGKIAMTFAGRYVVTASGCP